MTNYTTAAGVQQFTGTILSGNASVTININSVGSGAFVTFGGSNPSVTANFAEAGAYLSGQTSTTLVFTRQTGTTGTVVVTGSITDGDTSNLIVAVQYGTVSITAGMSGTASVTAPGSDANTVLHHLGNTGTGTTLAANVDYGVLTQSGNTVTATYPASGTTVTAFGLYEYQSSCLTANAVQRISATSASSVTSWTASLGANVVLNNAISFLAGSSIASVTTNDAESKMYGVLSGVGTFTAQVHTAVADAKTYKACILEHTAGVLNSSVQRGTTTLTGVTSKTTTLTAVNELYAGVSWLGNSTTAGVSQLGESTGAVVLTTAAVVASILHQSSLFTSLTPPTTTISGITSSTAGDALIAMFANINNANTSYAITAITDNKGQTWTQAGSAQGDLNGGGNVGSTDIWYFFGTAAGVTSLTVTAGTNAVVFDGALYEVVGLGTSPSVDAVNVLNTQTASTSQLTPQITTTVNGDLILGSISSGGTGSINSWAAPYTVDTSDGQTGWYIPAGTVTNSQATATNNKSATYCSSAIAFKASTATSDVIQVTKATATGNITGSWEVFEYPAYVNPSVTVNAWYPAVSSAIPLSIPGYDFIAQILPSEILNLLVPFLPRLPDIAAPNPPAPPSTVAMKPQAIITNTPILFLPRIVEAPPIVPVDKPNFFGFPLPLNFRLPWLLRLPDTAPPAPPPGYAEIAANVLPLNLKTPWLSRTVEAAPIILPDKSSVFSPPWKLNLPIKWLPESYIAAPLSVLPPEGAVSSPALTLHLSTPWLPRVSDASAIILSDKPNYFAPAFISSVIVIPWFPRTENATPITLADRPNFFAFPKPLNLQFGWGTTRTIDAIPSKVPAQAIIAVIPVTIAAPSIIPWFPSVNKEIPAWQSPPQVQLAIPEFPFIPPVPPTVHTPGWGKYYDQNPFKKQPDYDDEIIALLMGVI